MLTIFRRTTAFGTEHAFPVPADSPFDTPGGQHVWFSHATAEMRIVEGLESITDRICRSRR